MYRTPEERQVFINDLKYACNELMKDKIEAMTKYHLTTMLTDEKIQEIIEKVVEKRGSQAIALRLIERIMK